jgi:hypothetical protein
MMMSFIDAHREDLGIEPICHELAIAPSSYHEHARRLVDPGRRPARARRDDEIKAQIKRVHEASSGLYGARKVWHQLLRDGVRAVHGGTGGQAGPFGVASWITVCQQSESPVPVESIASRATPNALGGRFLRRPGRLVYVARDRPMPAGSWAGSVTRRLPQTVLDAGAFVPPASSR